MTMYDNDYDHRSDHALAVLDGATKPIGLGEEIFKPSKKTGQGQVISPLDGVDAQTVRKYLFGNYLRELARQEPHRLIMAGDEDFADHQHWTDEELFELAERGQEATVFNLTAIALNWVLGTERRASKDWKVLPRKKDGAKHAERKTELLKFISDMNRTNFSQSTAFRESVCAGISFLETGESVDSDLARVYDRHESWRNMVWDSTATEWDMSDARYMFRTKWMDVDMAAAMVPHRKGAIYRSMNRRVITGSGSNSLEWGGDLPMDSIESAHFDYMGTAGLYEFSSRDRVRMIEAWFMKPDIVPLMKGGQFHGQIFDEWSPGHWSDVKHERATLAAVPRRVMHFALMTEHALLDLRRTPYRHGKFPFTPIWGNRRSSDNMPYGIVRAMRSINRDLNKRMSKALHILSARTITMEQGSVEDKEVLREEAARPDSIIEYKAGFQPPVIKSDHTLAQAHMDLLTFDARMIQEVSGVTGENLGRDMGAQSGKAIIAKQGQGALTTSHYFDNLRFARQVHGEKVLANAEQFYTEEFQFRITDQRGNPDYVSINTDPMSGDDAVTLTRADFIVDETDWNASVRQANAESLLDLATKLAPTAPQMVVGILDLIVEALDVPKSAEIVKRIRQATGMSDPDADPDNPDEETIAATKAKQAEAQKAERVFEAEVSTKEAKAAETIARARKIVAEADAADRRLASDEIATLKSAIEAAIQIAGAPEVARAADKILSAARNSAPLQAPQTPLGATVQPQPQQALTQ